MKLKILLSAVITAVVFAACDSRSYIVFSSSSHDFGRVKAESTLSHTFSFRNTGNATLVIERIRSG